MLFGLTPADIISRIIVLLVAMSVHEFAHAYVAFRMGDPTAKEQGRMTLDPRANINPTGFIIGVLIGFAILGSAPVNPRRMRDPRWGMFMAVLAGPVSNLIVAAIFAIPFMLGIMQPYYGSGGGILAGAIPTIPQLFIDMVWLNVLLFVFNLLPLFPLDGWTVALSALPPRPAIWWERQRQNSMYVLYALIGLSFIGPSLMATLPPAWRSPLLSQLLNPLSFLIGEPTQAILRVLFNI